MARCNFHDPGISMRSCDNSDIGSSVSYFNLIISLKFDGQFNA
jgi:hypothetical protein